MKTLTTGFAVVLLLVLCFLFLVWIPVDGDWPGPHDIDPSLFNDYAPDTFSSAYRNPGPVDVSVPIRHGLMSQGEFNERFFAAAMLPAIRRRRETWRKLLAASGSS